MNQFKRIAESLSTRQKVMIAAVVLLACGLLYSLVQWRKEADFKPMYTGLAVEDSAAVVQKLKESGTDYRLSDSGDTISVPSSKIAELRLEMAAAGLPKTGRIGFEIFDKNNLGATEFVEHVNYRRALEGELERSVASLAEVEQARVHVTFPKDSVFLDAREPAKASVMVKLRPGMHLSARNVAAIAHLVSSAVEGLTPAGVSVLDMQGNLLSRPLPASPDEAASEAVLDYRQKLEHDLVQKITNTLDPLLGHDRYRASASVDCDLSSGEQSEETVDPARSVMTQSQKSEEMMEGAAPGGVPGTPSNLPRPTSRPGLAGGALTTRRTENVTYQSSRTVRTMKIPQGGIKRLSVALLLDQAVRWEGSGKNQKRVVIPPSPEMLKTVHDVVAAAVGFVQERGDQITVETLPFEETLKQKPEEVTAPAAPPRTSMPSWGDWKKYLPYLIGAAGLIILLLILAAVLLFRRKRQDSPPPPETTQNLPAGAAAATLESSNLAHQIEAQLAEREAAQEQADMLALASIKVPPVKTRKAEVLAKQLRENAKKDAASSAQILQTWIHERM